VPLIIGETPGKSGIVSQNRPTDYNNA
jgi:hypothetical protein